MQGRALDGRALADLIQQVVEGLNDRDIPTGGEQGGSRDRTGIPAGVLRGCAGWLGGWDPAPRPRAPWPPTHAAPLFSPRPPPLLVLFVNRAAAGSLVEYFNRELVQSCRDAYVRRCACPLLADAEGKGLRPAAACPASVVLQAGADAALWLPPALLLPRSAAPALLACPPAPLHPTPPHSLEQQALPVEEAALAQAHASARAAALAKFERERFGSNLEALRAALEAAVEREYR